MAHFAIIGNGVVVNRGVGNAADVAGAVACPAHVGIGWGYAGGTFSPPASAPAPPVTAHQVNTERNRRISHQFEFGGVAFQCSPEDRENISGASVSAMMAIMDGAAPGDLRWHGGDSDFVWIATDNELVPMDAPTMWAFGEAAMAHKTAHIFAARELKNADPIPEDYTDDAYWP